MNRHGPVEEDCDVITVQRVCVWEGGLVKVWAGTWRPQDTVFASPHAAWVVVVVGRGLGSGLTSACSVYPHHPQRLTRPHTPSTHPVHPPTRLQGPSKFALDACVGWLSALVAAADSTGSGELCESLGGLGAEPYLALLGHHSCRIQVG